MTVDLRKNLVLFSAPSATGKNTVYNALKERLPKLERAITVTTRQPRHNEIDGVDYYFLTEEEFKEEEANGGFVESNFYDNHYYATPYAEIERHGTTTPLFLIVDTKGMQNILKHYPLSVSIFLKPPSLGELEKRIRSRGDNTSEEIKRRISEAKQELEKTDQYEYVVVNEDLEECVDKIVRILRKCLEESGIPLT